ncbi:MAG: ABC transporter ATP-binding protein [Candidatus Margulisiibacteriota bacterium]|nr:MAG: macrolide ABC transporter ATP-binding protein [Candidatus Margulisbacteria bacterium GWD2_39_127]OGI03627.1 MAG: macrolide ABC transporter ATP-binding protein [Candidatus Margulisbacteria bacterium GWF2_38_17]OGI11131.1 MAG: macrolide ABC transporter ATP-binding protein [Candidatus Margulisbacteria bacterium GWE2_39_32]PZM78235.1 MAG: ABC transporter ATP-binding protein [Candidatus Margulisiibacteriota bacterium]HAR64360.1 macrolide ABC transporter ATP-binding protein [Candidatus Margul
MALVEVAELTKIYTETHVPTTALKNVSVTVHQGEFAALVGPSGSGKTTLLNLIGGLDTPTGGSVFLDNINLSGLKEKFLARFRLMHVGFVFQSYNLIPVLTALENVEYVMLLQGISGSVRRQRAQQILEEVGIGDFSDRRPADMSGGQQQRVAIARAIVSEPKLVLADEPTANLDSVTGRQLLELMRNMNRKKNITFIFSTHDPMVMDYARRIIMLKDGIIVKDEVKS